MKYFTSGSGFASSCSRFCFSADRNSLLPALRSSMHFMYAESLSAALTMSCSRSCVSPVSSGSYAPRSSSGSVSSSMLHARFSTCRYAPLISSLWYFIGVGRSPVRISELS